MSRAAPNCPPELDDVATGASANVSVRSCPNPATAHHASTQPANPNRTIQPRTTLRTNHSPIGWGRPSIFSHSAWSRRSPFSFCGSGTRSKIPRSAASLEPNTPLRNAGVPPARFRSSLAKNFPPLLQNSFARIPGNATLPSGTPSYYRSSRPLNLRNPPPLPRQTRRFVTPASRRLFASGQRAFASTITQLRMTKPRYGVDE